MSKAEVQRIICKHMIYVITVQTSNIVIVQQITQ